MKDQADLFQAETTWFHFLRDMIESGDMAKLGGSAMMVYLVIKSYTNFATGMSFPKIEKIAEKAGLSQVQVKRCLKALEESGYITKEKDGRHNVYTLREKVVINDENGRPQAVATWDYIPNNVKAAIAELKHAVVTGEMMGGKIIHIENMVFNVFTDHSSQINLNSIDLAKVSPEVRESLLSLRKALNKKKLSTDG